ncbi:tail fibers protein [Salmonella phage vB_SenP_UTK0001]|nr:tail fibers protein [Salmonella phage vB_SenP_UTK0001]
MNQLFSQGGKGSAGILTNKQAVARHFGVKQSEIVYFSVGVDISGYKVIYDKTTQRAYSLPIGIPAGTTAISLSTAAVLVHSQGSVDLGAVAVLRKEYVTIPGDFTSGATIQVKNEILTHSNGAQYRWAGAVPKVVPAGSTPASSGGISASAWIEVTGEELRDELATTGGASQIGTSDGKTVQQWIIANDSANYRARNIQKLAWVDKQVHSRGSIKVLFQGDSMTAGYDTTSTDRVPANNGDWATHASMTYPQRFMAYLPEQSGCSVTGIYRAISGHTAIQSYNEPSWQSNPNCDVVILMLGLNDAGGVAGTTEDIYMEYMEKLIRRFIDWGMGVVVQTCSTGGQGSGGIVANLWAKRMRMMADTYGCAHFNADEVQYYRHNGAVQSDGGHFNSMGYAIHGQMLASMFMAGGLLPTYRPLTNEINTWCGRLDDSIGYCDATGNVNLGRSDGAYTRTKVVGGMVANAASIATFSFYLDAEAAHIFVHGSGAGPVNVLVDAPSWWSNGAQDYYDFANNQTINFSNSPQAANNAIVDLSTTYSADRKFVGRILGRGWKTLTFFTRLDGTGGDFYLNSLTVQPVPVGMSVQARNWARFDKGHRAVYSKKIPQPYNQASLPAAAALVNFQVPMPQSMLPTTPSISGDLGSNFYNCGHSVLKISNTNGDYLEVLLIKTTGGGYVFTGKILKTTYATENQPTAITATAAHYSMKDLKVAGANGPNMPLETIRDIDMASYVTIGVGAGNGGLVLDINITWPSTPPTSYWNIELEAWDMFGNSEASI